MYDSYAKLHIFHTLYNTQGYEHFNNTYHRQQKMLDRRLSILPRIQPTSNHLNHDDAYLIFQS